MASTRGLEGALQPAASVPHTPVIPHLCTHHPPQPGTPCSRCLGAPTHHCLENSYSSCLGTSSSRLLTPPPPRAAWGALSRHTPLKNLALAPIITLYPTGGICLLSCLPRTRLSAIKGSHITRGNIVCDLTLRDLCSPFLVHNGA